MSYSTAFPKKKDEFDSKFGKNFPNKDFDRSFKKASRKNRKKVAPALFSFEQIKEDFNLDSNAKKEPTNLLLISLAKLINHDKEAVSIQIFEHIVNNSDGNANPALHIDAHIHSAKQRVNQHRFDQAFQSLEKATALLARIDNLEAKENLETDIAIAYVTLARAVKKQLYHVCMNGDVDTLKMYLAMPGVKPSKSLIIAATRSKKLEMVKFIHQDVLKGGLDYTDYDQWNAAHYGSQLNCADILDYLYQRQQNIFEAKIGKGTFRAGSQTCMLIATDNNALDAIG